ncbi:amino acid permease [Candidatus Palauibacter sp.]|uniref:amino acid permease n=1 Tax=Candidatus Palauibacter sp. TaxID=3101350 RepID=UPI003C6EAFFA
MTRRPALGLWMCTALVVGSMVGSGVFLLPASLSPYGGISIVGWLVSAGGAMCLALVMARLGALVPRVGGPYAFAREGFGDFVGFWVAWAYWISLLTANAALAVATVSYATVFWPGLGDSPAAGAIAALVVLWGLVLVNVRGVRTAGQVQLVTTVLKLLPLAAVGTIGFLYFQGGHFRPFNPSGGSPVAAVTATVTLTLWAFMGLEAATVPAADVRDPVRTIPRATILGTVIAAVIFIVSTSAVMGIIAPADLAVSTAPFADAAGSIWGDGGRLVIGAGATIACFGALNGWMLLSGQLPRAAALDGLLPAAFGRLGPRGTPWFGLVFAGAVATILIAMNYSRGLVQAFTFLILLSTLSTLLAYVFASATGLLFALRERLASPGTKAPVGRMAVSTLAFGFSFWAIAGAGPETVFWGFLLLVAGVPVFVLMRVRSSRAETGQRIN